MRFDPESKLDNLPEVIKPRPGSDQLQPFAAALYPSTWRFRPVLGKHPLVKGWVKAPLTAENAISAYQDGHVNESGQIKYFNGFAVFTGEMSGGLLALDIDGPTADSLYKELAKEEYEEFGKESTMAVTSGKTARRQIFYQVPTWMLPWLSKFNLLHLEDRREASVGQKKQELVLRFNQCYSVLPGSIHPETKEYKLTNKNGNNSISDAPDWITDILTANFKASNSFLTPEILQVLEESVTSNGLPDNQLLGWFSRAETQSLVTEKLFEVFYHHHVFENWNDSNTPRTSNFCPFHGGDSGDSFHIDTTPGSGHPWHCKVCNKGGGPLQFLAAVKTQNIEEPLPSGIKLQNLISQVAADLGLTYPDDLLPVKKVSIVPALGSASDTEKDINGIYRQALLIRDQSANSEIAKVRVHKLFNLYGITLRTGRDALISLSNWERQENNIAQQKRSINFNPDKIASRYLIPDLIKIPNLIMMHGGSGAGKTRVALGLAKIIGENLSIKIRGTQVKPLIQGCVLYICDDMAEDNFISYCSDLGIEGKENNWLKAIFNWQSDELWILKKHILEFKPVLIVIDSLSSVSSKTGISENDPACTDFLKELHHRNGRDWPSSAIMVIHHDKKDGTDFRGSSAIRASFDEIFHLKKLTEDEIRIHGRDALMLTITKSRSNRDFAQLLVRTDINGRITFLDLDKIDDEFTSGASAKLGIKELVLCLLRKGGITASEIYNKICSIYTGRGDKDVSDELDSETIQRHIDTWCTAGLLKIDDEQVFYDDILEPTYKATKGTKVLSNTFVYRNMILDTFKQANYWLDVNALTEQIFESTESRHIVKLRIHLERLIDDGKIKTHRVGKRHYYAYVGFSGEPPESHGNLFQDSVINALSLVDTWLEANSILGILQLDNSPSIKSKLYKNLKLLQETDLIEIKKFRFPDSLTPINYYALKNRVDLLPPSGISGGTDLETLPTCSALPLSGALPPSRTPWVPLPPEGNSQDDWACQWQDLD